MSRCSLKQRHSKTIHYIKHHHPQSANVSHILQDIHEHGHFQTPWLFYNILLNAIIWITLNNFSSNNIIFLNKLVAEQYPEDHNPYLNSLKCSITSCCHVTYTNITCSYTFAFLVLYLWWGDKEGAPKTWYVQTVIAFLYILYILVLFILILCYFNIISEWLLYYIYIYTQDPFHEEYLIKLTHLQHQLQVIKWY